MAKMSQMITEHVQLIMVVIGLMTVGALSFSVAPAPLGKLLFSAPEVSPGLIMMIRHWGFVIFLVGVFLIYAAFHPACRAPALAIAGLGKSAFAGLVFWGPFKMSRFAQLAATGDGILALLCFAWLAGL
jgi:hypothetical protein